MPYTPPSQRSPASSQTSSPALSRSQSYLDQNLVASPVSISRPSLPRSISSTAYLSKHRRTPSISSNNGNQSSLDNAGASSLKASSSNGSLRQAPSPVNSSLIPSGAITTPPDSAQGSDDEDRGRDFGSLVELQQALQSIEVKRTGSPIRSNNNQSHLSENLKNVPHISTQSSPALTPEARKISHSRSSSDIHLPSQAKVVLSPSPLCISEDSDLEDDELRMKPPLLRKKSGELVKPALRPSSRRRPSSMPGTPTFSKAVHFNEDIEQVRHFLQVDKPIAVSAGSSPVETYDSETEYPFHYKSGSAKRKVEWELRLANFPRDTFERSTAPVRVERIFLSSDKEALVGTVAVANLSFHKSVVARFTLDYWKTTSEVSAEYNNDIRKTQASDGYDRFNFNIKLADQINLESKTLLICIRYNVSGQEFWDNNNNMNYQVDFVKKVKAKENKSSKLSNGSLSVGAIPRSKSASNSGRPRSFPSALDDDFGSGFDSNFEFGSRFDTPQIKLKPKTRPGKGNPFSHDTIGAQSNQGGNPAFSTRYDFSASLSAALTNAQSALGDRSGIIIRDPPTPKNEQTPSPPSGSRFESTEKPDVKSAEYNELIQKFCFFGSSGKVTPPQQSRSPATTPPRTEAKSVSPVSTPPPTPQKEMYTAVDGAFERDATKSPKFLSRSSSPGTLTGPIMSNRVQSPMNFGYPYNHNMPSGILNDNHTPQPILG